jgi:hypothetical protein
LEEGLQAEHILVVVEVMEEIQVLVAGLVMQGVAALGVILGMVVMERLIVAVLEGKVVEV